MPLVVEAGAIKELSGYFSSSLIVLVEVLRAEEVSMSQEAVIISASRC